VAHSKSALKRWRQNERHRERNKSVRTSARTAVKRTRTAIAANDGSAPDALRQAMSVLDRAAKRRVIHPNAAARHKSRLMRHLNEAAAPAPAAEAPAKRTRRAAAPAKPKAAPKPKAATTRTRAKKAE